MVSRMGKIGVYSDKTRAFQRRLTFEAFGLTFKEAHVYLYQGDKNSDIPDIDKFESKVFYEVPDRVYAATPVAIPVGVDQFDESKMDFSRFGLINPMTNEQRFKFHIDDFVTLGRELVIGDVFEIPFFSRNGKKAMWEVTDVDMKSAYEKFICVVHATVLEAGRDVVDIPFDRDNWDVMETNMNEADIAFNNDINSSEPSYDHTTEPADSPDDYRDDLQADFLDDPTKEF